MVHAYYGTTRPLTPGTTIYLRPSPYPRAEVALDVGRSPRIGMRSAAVWAAGTIKEATAIAAIRAHKFSELQSHSTIRVYRVWLAAFHLGPFAILDELQQRMTAGRHARDLIQEYWSPEAGWYLKELVAPCLTVAEEVTPASEAETYIPRWVQFSADLERAQSF